MVHAWIIDIAPVAPWADLVEVMRPPSPVFANTFADVWETSLNRVDTVAPRTLAGAIDDAVFQPVITLHLRMWMIPCEFARTPPRACSAHPDDHVAEIDCAHVGKGSIPDVGLAAVVARSPVTDMFHEDVVDERMPLVTVRTPHPPRFRSGCVVLPWVGKS